MHYSPSFLTFLLAYLLIFSGKGNETESVREPNTYECMRITMVQNIGTLMAKLHSM